MRKLLQVFLVLAFVLASCVGAYAQEPQPIWYELDEEETVLTITLPANATTGYEWDFVISDPEAFELLTQEYVPDGNDELIGTVISGFLRF